MTLRLTRKYSLLAILAVIPVLLLISSNIAVGIGPKEINAVGQDGVKINSIVFSTMHFAPGRMHIKSGQSVVFSNLKTTDPHTYSVVNQADLPTTVGEVFACGGPGTVCETLLAQHFPSGPPVAVLNTGGSGLDSVGDSVLLFPGESYVIQVTAPTHTTLHIICAIHSWMQMTIVVDG